MVRADYGAKVYVHKLMIADWLIVLYKINKQKKLILL